MENTTSIEFREANMQLQIVEPDPSDVTDGIVFEEDGDANETVSADYFSIYWFSIQGIIPSSEWLS